MTTKELQPDTGVADPLYNLVLTFQQAMSDTHRFTHFAQDAREHGDEELADLFDELTENDRELSGRLRRLLAARLAE
jgi:rubrerythrin